MTKPRKIHPDEFAEQMQKIKDKYGWGIETVHLEMDNYMCDLLRRLGYSSGVDIFKSTFKWYA